MTVAESGNRLQRIYDVAPTTRINLTKAIIPDNVNFTMQMGTAFSSLLSVQNVIFHSLMANLPTS